MKRNGWKRVIKILNTYRSEAADGRERGEYVYLMDFNGLPRFFMR